MPRMGPRGFLRAGGTSSRRPRISRTSSRESVRDSFPYPLAEEFPEKTGESPFSFLDFAPDLGRDRLARKRIRFQVNETGHCLAFQPGLQCPEVPQFRRSFFWVFEPQGSAQSARLFGEEIRREWRHGFRKYLPNGIPIP